MEPQEYLDFVSKYPHSVRFLTFLSNCDAGLSTLIDCLIASHCVLISEPYRVRMGDVRSDDEDRAPSFTPMGPICCMLSSAAEDDTSLRNRVPEKTHLTSTIFHLVDPNSPVDSLSENHPWDWHPAFGRSEESKDSPPPPIPSSLQRFRQGISHICFADGVVIILDLVELGGYYASPISFLTDSSEMSLLLRECILRGKRRPIYVLNKLDRLIVELQWNEMEIYHGVNGILESIQFRVNVICDEAFFDPDSEESIDRLDYLPELLRSGTGKNAPYGRAPVVFASAKYSYGFTVRTFAELYEKKMGISADRLERRLYGDWRFDAPSRKWKRNRSAMEMNGFAKFVMNPVMQMHDVILKGKTRKLKKMIRALHLQIPDLQFYLDQNRETRLLRVVLRTWMPLSKHILQCCQRHHLSPLDRQRMTTSPALRESPSAPLLMHVYRICFSTPRYSNSAYVCGRVLSGVLERNAKVVLMGPSSTHRTHARVEPVHGLSLMFGRYPVRVPEILTPVGAVIAFPISLPQVLALKESEPALYKHLCHGRGTVATWNPHSHIPAPLAGFEPIEFEGRKADVGERASTALEMMSRSLDDAKAWSGYFGRSYLVRLMNLSVTLPEWILVV